MQVRLWTIYCMCAPRHWQADVYIVYSRDVCVCDNARAVQVLYTMGERNVAYTMGECFVVSLCALCVPGLRGIRVVCACV